MSELVGIMDAEEFKKLTRGNVKDHVVIVKYGDGILHFECTNKKDEQCQKLALEIMEDFLPSIKNI